MKQKIRSSAWLELSADLYQKIRVMIFGSSSLQGMIWFRKYFAADSGVDKKRIKICKSNILYLFWIIVQVFLFKGENIFMNQAVDRKKAKRVEESKIEHVYQIRPEHLNGAGRLFGGRLMEWN